MFMLKPPLTSRVIGLGAGNSREGLLSVALMIKFWSLQENISEILDYSILFEDVVRGLSTSQEPNRMLFYRTVKTSFTDLFSYYQTCPRPAWWVVSIVCFLGKGPEKFTVWTALSTQQF